MINRTILSRSLLAGAVAALGLGSAQLSANESIETRGYVEHSSHIRDGVGLTRFRNRLQFEFNMDAGDRGIFSNVSINGTIRATYDGVYDINDTEFGDDSGGPLSFPAPGNPAFFAELAASAPPPFVMPPGPPFVSTNPSYAGVFGPPPAFGGGGAIPLPGANPLYLGVPPGGPNNPNEGLKFLGSDLHSNPFGGGVLAYPSRPCDHDSRGCLDDYMDRDLDELRMPDFNDDLDFLRELYIDATIPFSNGHELGLTLGRQQVVWGRTDLFRVLDIINPVDFSANNIYEELEDARIPMLMLTGEYRMGPVGAFDDLNFQVVWKLEKPRPHNLGQGGQPYAILGAGNLFRALSNCWDNGCTFWNFPATGLAVDFPTHVIGIRDVNRPGDAFEEVGFRVEGVFKGVGFSLNAMTFFSQLPSLRGGIPADNPFTPNPIAIESQFFPYNFAFDIEFPRIDLIGGSADFYIDSIKSAFRVELAYTSGEEFANTIEERLFSESDVVRWVIGWDRPTFIPFLNKNRSFLISAQLFGQHLLDHEEASVNSAGIPTLRKIGMPDWENNYIFTLLIQGNYMNDRITPQIITAWDFSARSGAVAPTVTWKPDNNWVVTAGFNIKWGEGAREYDDNLTANIFAPDTCAPPLRAAMHPACAASFSSLGKKAIEPLGRFRAGPIGNAIDEDEFQITVRYQF